MRRTIWALSLALLCTFSIGIQSQQAPAVPSTSLPPVPAREPAWAFPVQAGTLPPEPPGPKKVPGSAKTYTVAEIDNLLAPPDWFPNEHPAAPPIIQTGRGAALACGSCHLMNGAGHPESADTAGFTAGYLIQQMADFKSGVRKDYARMNGIAAALSDDEIRQASEWFALLKPQKWNRVVEAAIVPRTFVGQGRMRFASPEGGTEPIGNRIITLPEDQERARLRDPKSGFVVYVPVGSLARGRSLVETGASGKSIQCAVCHGDGLKGLGNVPRLAGLHPIYTARQLHLFKDGGRNGIDAQLMKKAVAALSNDDILAISAYLGSLAP
jgi:cytochrome c553